MHIVDSAIIIRTFPVKSNQNVVKLLTRSHGIQTAYLSAGTKKKSVKNAVLQPLSLCQVTLKKNKNSSLLNLKEARIDIPFINIQLDIVKSTIVLFLADFLDHVLLEDHEEVGFDFLQKALQILNEIELGKSVYHLAFLVKMMQWLGIQPSLKKDKNHYLNIKEGVFESSSPNHPYYFSKSETQLFAYFVQSEWTQLSEVRLTKEERGSFLNNIILYYTFHIPGFKKPQSLSILEEVFS
ncbi:MAG: DNA repair protein RecO [Flavobacteriales bacterium]|nr:DNA repair protein RecO [Flavobacteriales bacterium]|tara:strand:- start:2398 stop:3114 length:717 start_codon:yes stop_codon:yes gene_type:complete